MESFNYQALSLDKAEIRLIRILPGSDDEDIECDLLSFNFDTPEHQVPYEALSYAWGSSLYTDEIFIGDESLPVTKSLYIALQYLRLKDSPRVMWIDAICINQSNKEERGHQVHQMADIYKTAERVVVWLGSSIRWQTEILMQALKALESKSREHTGCRYWEVCDPRWLTLWSEVLSDTQKPLVVMQEGLRVLLNRGWWSRVWIIQEVANTNLATVMAGMYSVSARIFALAPTLLRMSPPPHCQAVLDVFPGPSREHSWWNQDRTLKRLLLKFGGSAASDPRDKVYALLGLSTDAYKTTDLAANYKIDLAEVIKNTLSFVFRYHDARITLCLPDGVAYADFPGNIETISSALLRKTADENLVAEAGLLLGQDIVDSNTINAHGQTPIYVAAIKGQQELVSLFLRQQDVIVNPMDSAGRTLLSRLAEKGDIKGVSQIVSNLKPNVHAPDADGVWPLWYAIENDHVGTVNLLLQQSGYRTGVDIPSVPQLNQHLSRTQCIVTIQSLLETIGLSGLDNLGRSVLCHSACLGLLSLVRYLIKHGIVDVNSKCRSHRTALSYAAAYGHNHVIQYLLERKDIEADGLCDHLRTPLHYAAMNGHTQVVKSLLGVKSVNVNQASVTGITPLIAAIGQGQTKATQMLLRQEGIDVNLQDNLGFAPLHHAVFWANEVMGSSSIDDHYESWRESEHDMVGLLLREDKIAVNIKCVKGRTPISYAAENRSLKALKSLVNARTIDVHARDPSGRVTLWYAAYWARVDNVSLLLNYFDNSTCRDNHGFSPLDISAATVSDKSQHFVPVNALASKSRSRFILTLLESRFGIQRKSSP